MKRVLLIVLFMLLILTQSTAQRLVSFASDSVAYIEDLHTFMESSKTFADKGKITVKRFEKVWFTPKITDTLRKQLYFVSNTLLKRQAKPFPHFNQWLNITTRFFENDDIGVNFYAFQNAVVQMSKDEKYRLYHLQSFLQSITQLVELGHINVNGSTIWKSNADDYAFAFDSESLRIKFPESNLTCVAVRDSIKLYNTVGEYDPIDKKWYGESGITFWERAGYHRDSVYATFDQYTINMQLSTFEVDTVKFYNHHFFNYPLFGKLTDRVTEIPTPEKAVYPEFISFESNFNIKDIFKDIHFVGGFNIKGYRFYGIGANDRDALLNVFRDVEVVRNGDTIIENMLFMTFRSQAFVLTDKVILSQDAKVSITLENDSLYHPGLQMSYLERNKEFSLLRSDNALNMSQSPFYDSYHRFEIDIPMVKWKVGESKIIFSSLQNSTINNARFLSYNLFNRKFFDMFQGFDFQHPFYKIRAFLHKKERQTYHASEIGQVLHQAEHEARKFLLQLTYLGFTDYDKITKEGRMKDKFYDYLEYVVGRKDYDIIEIESITEGRENAVLNLKNLDFYVSGVPQIHISNAKRVNIYPKNDEIVIKKDRDINFAGVIETGYYTFYGRNFHFKYNKFGVDLEHIDSLHIKVVDYYDNFGKPVFKQVQSTIEDITGSVLIDEVSNKSGVKDNPQYPIFKSTKDSYVYYDESHIAHGVYTRDTFFFRIDPYEIDSLNSFDSQGLKYTGTFYSGEIFSAIDEELQLMPDNSLGFEYETPEAGIPIYKGKAQYYSTIKMSNKGLQGDGKLEYLTSTMWSDEMKFYPDTTRMLANRFENIEQIAPFETPEIHGENLNVLWRLDMEKLYATTTTENASMYNSQGELKGTFYLNDKGIEGHGNFLLDRGRFKSNNYHFLSQQLTANVSDFNLKGLDPETFSLKADSIKTVVDFTTRKAKFEALSVLKPMFFPINQYKAYINTFEWGIDDNALALVGNSVHRYENGRHTLQPTSDAKHPMGALFVSTHPLQHELNFVSPKADVNLSNNFIEAHQVRFIEIADATVYPGDGEFTVRPDARYKTLVDAEILANNDTKFHRFYNATVNVQTRKKYSASGYYDYIDKFNKAQKIRFDVIGVDTAITTFATGKVLGDDDFTLSPAFDFRGDVFLTASEKHLDFKGHFMASKNCDMYQKRWVKFQNVLNPDSIQISIDSVTVDINETRVYKGIMLEHDSVHILPRFFTPRNHYTNYYITTANGVLQYDEIGKKYEIADAARLQKPDTLLNYISMNTETCDVYGEGNISLTGDYGQLKVENFGKANYFHQRNETILDLFSTIDFFIAPECVKYMADTIKNSKSLQSVNMLSDRYKRGLKNLVGHKMTEQLINEQKLFGAYKKFPDELNHTFVMSSLNFTWNEKDGTFHSLGDIGITSIGDVQVNRYVKGAVQAGTSRTGDYFILYLEITPSHWFFFKYKRGIMMAVSSDPAFNKIIKDLPARHRKQKVERGQPKFYYYLASMNDKNRFLQDYRAAELEESDSEDGDNNDTNVQPQPNNDEGTKDE